MFHWIGNIGCSGTQREHGKTKRRKQTRIETITKEKATKSIRAMAKSAERTKSVLWLERTKAKTRHSNCVAMQRNARHDKAIRYNTIQYNTIQSRMKTTVRANEAFGLVGRCCFLLTWTMCWTLTGSSLIFAVVRRDFPRPWRLFPRSRGGEECWGGGWRCCE